MMYLVRVKVTDNFTVGRLTYSITAAVYYYVLYTLRYCRESQYGGTTMTQLDS